MKTPASKPLRRCGFSLIETAIALAVLVAAVPMVFLALGEAGKSAMASEAESRGTWIVPICLEEIRGSREGRSRWFSSTAMGDSIPPDGELWALAFSASAKVVGVISEESYDAGVTRMDHQTIRYIATMKSTLRDSDFHPGLRIVCITLEYPAAAPIGRREKFEYHTLIP